MTRRFRPLVCLLAFSFGAAGCSRLKREASPLIASTTTMVTAWQVPQNPLEDKSLDHSLLGEQIRWGYRIFTNTPREASRCSGGQISCANCHLNVGQRERALPLVGVAGMFPEYNNRAARLISLADRVVDCFLRSENATGRLAPARPAGSDSQISTGGSAAVVPASLPDARIGDLPTPTS